MSDDRGKSAQPSVPGTGHAARRGGIWIGAILVIAGFLMLLGPYFSWAGVLNLWPLIIVAAGVAQMVRIQGEAPVKRVAEGLGTVAVGLVLLANTLGYVSWTVWITMLSLWPLLVVALGIELLGRGLRFDWLRAVSNLVLIAALAYGVLVLGPGWHAGVPLLWVSTSNTATYERTVPRDVSAHDGSAVLKAGATRLTLAAGDQLVRVSGRGPAGSPPSVRGTVSSGTADVSITDVSTGPFVVGLEDRSMDVRLDRSLTWNDVRMDIGAATADIDLRDMIVRKVEADMGATDARLRIGRLAHDVKVDIAGGVSNLTVLVPADAAVNVDTRSGLSAVTVPSTFEHVSGIPVFGPSTWSAKGSGGPNITLDIQSGVSNLTIETE